MTAASDEGPACPFLKWSRESRVPYLVVASTLDPGDRPLPRHSDMEALAAANGALAGYLEGKGLRVPKPGKRCNGGGEQAA